MYFSKHCHWCYIVMHGLVISCLNCHLSYLWEVFHLCATGRWGNGPNCHISLFDKLKNAFVNLCFDSHCLLHDQDWSSKSCLNRITISFLLDPEMPFFWGMINTVKSLLSGNINLIEDLARFLSQVFLFTLWFQNCQYWRVQKGHVGFGVVYMCLSYFSTIFQPYHVYQTCSGDERTTVRLETERDKSLW